MAREAREIKDIARTRLLSVETHEGQESPATRDATKGRGSELAQGRLAAIVQSSLDAIVGKEIDGTVTSWNPAATELFGWTSDEIVGRRIDVLIPPERRNEEDELLLKVAAGERIEPYETERLTNNGNTVQVCLSCSPIRNALGDIEGIASIYRDIGWIKKREVMFQALLEAAHDAIVGVDAEGEIQVVNAQAEKLFGYERSDLIGQPVEILIPQRITDNDPDETTDSVEHRTTRPMRGGVELSARHKDGREFPVDIALSSLETDEGVIGVAVRDISDRIRAVQEKKELEEQLKRSRLESIGQLVGGIAHDFNNLLAGIMSYSKLVQDQVREVVNLKGSDALEQVLDDAEQIVQATERAAALTRQLLLFGRQEAVRSEVLDLNEIVSGMEKLLRRTIGEQIRLVTDLTDPLRSVHVDAGHLEQVLMNLVVNGRDAMPSGGHLSIRTKEQVLDDDYAIGQGIEAGDYITLSVSDTGSGMPPDVLERVFEPYFSTKPRGEGSGLGLATVYGIVRQSGGHIAVTSEVGLGTTVTVYLPAVEGPATHPAVTAQPAVGIVRGETILLVEDEEIVREPAARFLRNAGYDVFIAADPAEAIELADAHEGTINLLLTDVVMPGMTGKELAEKLLLSASIERVLYMSGYSTDVIAHHGAIDPGVTLLEKPFTDEKLLAVVRDLLDSRPR